MPESPRFPLCFKMPRLFGWAVITVVLMVGLYWFAPQQLPIVAYKLALVTLAVTLAYWLDRALFPYARPGTFFGRSQFLSEGSDQQTMLLAAALAAIRRAIIVFACVIGLALGL